MSRRLLVLFETGVVVENFSFVFQSTGSAKSITRDEMRAFKKVWAEFENRKTGLLERSQLVPFLAVSHVAGVDTSVSDAPIQKLRGIFEVRIYPSEFSVPNLLAAASDQSPSPGVVQGVNLAKLNEVLNHIDHTVISKRRDVYSRIYHEANILYVSNRGIAFTDMLLLLAHYKLIVDKDALVSVTSPSTFQVRLITISQAKGFCRTERNQQGGHRSCEFG